MPKRKAKEARKANGPLPPGDGPSLDEFEHSDSPIEWKERLDGDRKGGQAFVYRVTIASHDYALKIFKFTDPRSDPLYPNSPLEDLPLKEALKYTDPFYAECRAYGRIRDGRVVKNSRSRRAQLHAAVRCYGYLLLRDNDADEFNKLGHDLETNVLDPKLRKALGGDTRIRAIVKHFDDGPREINKGNIRQAWAGIRLMNHSLKIYNMHIGSDNFIGHRLVDFSTSWTEPHEILRYLDDADPESGRKIRSADAEDFDYMIRAERIQTRLQVLPTSRHQLRSKGKVPEERRELRKRRRKGTILRSPSSS
ncbi:hypothetical protein SAMD00023353_6300530 [Rosellinia necatrix]|uniref:Protein kinase domain-containing protein n=1 Tax=Rosellinia necatrix TaxID=77044 RepID=A0A1W2TSA6_ROSNE|nr:hypothetical protein SAMD00023353_6300530 [Rosellinia necatrix]